MLINCVAYQNGVKIADLSVEAISDYLERPDCFVWVALRDATDAELDKMQKEFGLHDLAVEDARHGHQRPKIEEYGDTLFVVMHMVEVVRSRSCGRRRSASSPATISSFPCATAAAGACLACANAASASRNC